MVCCVNAGAGWGGTTWAVAMPLLRNAEAPAERVTGLLELVAEQLPLRGRARTGRDGRIARAACGRRWGSWAGPGALRGRRGRWAPPLRHACPRECPAAS